MNDAFDAAELPKLTHILQERTSREIPMIPALIDDAFGKWALWVVVGEGKLVRLQGGEPVEGEYFAKKADAPEDVHFLFLDFATQHISWGDVNRHVGAVRNDVHNLGAVLTTLEVLHKASREGTRVERCVVNEIEHVLVVCRAIFDHCHLILEEMRRNQVMFTDPGLEKKRKGVQLPPSFGAIALAGEKPRTPEEIESRWGLPPPWARFYVDEAPFFLELRALRDATVHLGADKTSVFTFEDGFALDTRGGGLKKLYTWHPAHLKPNELGALLPFLAHIIDGTLAMLNRAAKLLGTLKLPPEIAPGMRVFSRGHHVHKLSRLPRAPTENPWALNEAKPGS